MPKARLDFKLRLWKPLQIDKFILLYNKDNKAILFLHWAKTISNSPNVQWLHLHV